MTRSLSSAEQADLQKIEGEYRHKIAELVAQVVVHFPDAIQEPVLIYLQDRASLFSPTLFDWIQQELKTLRAQACTIWLCQSCGLREIEIGKTPIEAKRNLLSKPRPSCTRCKKDRWTAFDSQVTLT